MSKVAKAEKYYDPQFCGTDHWWRHPYGLVYTDSIKDFVEEYKAYWTLDVVGSYVPELKAFPFLILYFDVQDSHCTFHVREDTDTPDVVTQDIEYTDLRVSVKLYLCDGVLMFPSDY